MTIREQDVPRLLREARASLDSSARYTVDAASPLDNPLRDELLALVQDMRGLSNSLKTFAERVEQ